MSYYMSNDAKQGLDVAELPILKIKVKNPQNNPLQFYA